MTRDPTSKTALARRMRAVAIVAAVVIAVPGVEAATRLLAPSQVGATFNGGLDAAYLMAAGNIDTALQRLEDAAAVNDASVPEDFSREIGFLADARAIRVSEDGTVVGYVVPCKSEDAASQLCEHMEALSWTAVSLGGTEGATFVKREGVYRWALATCTQIGLETTVVIRSVIT